MSYMIGYILAFIAMLCFGSYVLFIKKAVMKLGYYLTTVFMRILSLAFLIILFIFFIDIKPISPQSIAPLLITIISGALAILLYFKAVNYGKLSIIATISNSYAIFTVLFSYIFLHEVLSIAKYILILFIVLGIFLISIDLKQLKKLRLRASTKGIGIALMVAVLWGLWTTFSKTTMQIYGSFTGLTYVEIGISLFLILPALVKPRIFKKPDKKA